MATKKQLDEVVGLLPANPNYSQYDAERCVAAMWNYVLEQAALELENEAINVAVIPDDATVKDLLTLIPRAYSARLRRMKVE